ncbi:hypothetical protein [Mycolicibacterium hodleri]|jgi:hypothetical protein|uniref:hypothetical protein n=1 Tax=Mycolicibacterium hodleri TaxID=49897 RepID=UPI00163CC974|nr:hypothetical protein [Mycolicibacterium hodleri]
MTALESTLIDIVIRYGDPVATALIRWLITGEHTALDVTIDLAWPQPGTPNPFQ